MKKMVREMTRVFQEVLVCDDCGTEMVPATTSILTMDERLPMFECPNCHKIEALTLEMIPIKFSVPGPLQTYEEAGIDPPELQFETVPDRITQEEREKIFGNFMQ